MYNFFNMQLKINLFIKIFVSIFATTIKNNNNMKEFKKGDVVYYIQNGLVYAGIITDVGICTLTVNDIVIDKPFVYTDRKNAELVCLFDKSTCYTKTIANLFCDIINRNTEIIKQTGILPTGIETNTFPFEGQLIHKGNTIEYKHIMFKQNNDSIYGYDIGFCADENITWVVWDDNFTVNIDAILELNYHLERHLRKIVNEL